MTKFHENWAKNVTSRRKMPRPLAAMFFHRFDWAEIVTSRVFTRKTAPPTGGHANILTKFHENWAKNVTSRRKMSRPMAAMFFSPIWTIFELVRDINKTNVLTTFHEDWEKIVTSRVFTREKCSVHWRPCFSPIWTIFELVRDTCINKTNVLTNFHDDWAKIVTSRVFTRFLVSQIGKTAPPTGGHVFQRTQLSNQFYEEINAPPPGGHVFQHTRTIYHYKKKF
ncbi:hypothetical protein DPMN_035719 [Dreissena polymorpha]|uniref:Uncharacterized protein n=1 Tax=Dreissena polymorpha TaxID=45954 RepID=A0A9D4RM94_DREPO|nr:hypothetical protein DPMN_035719 [Dreissena polymorpha]